MQLTFFRLVILGGKWLNFSRMTERDFVLKLIPKSLSTSTMTPAQLVKLTAMGAVTAYRSNIDIAKVISSVHRNGKTPIEILHDQNHNCCLSYAYMTTVSVMVF